MAPQIANIGPIAYSLLSAFRPSLRPASVIYGVLVIGCLSSLLLCVLWQETTWVGGAEHSTALLALVFLLSLVDCTSSVLYMPYMAVWRGIYLPSYLVGEGLSGLLPALVALAQGVGGNSECINVTNPDNTTSLQPAPLQPLFSVTDFFFILFGMMVASALAFILLEKLPSIRSERTSLPGPTYGESAMEASRSNTQLVGRETTPSPKAEPHCMSKRMYAVMLLGQGWACMLTNGVLPSIQSYSCGAYGNVAYHLAASLSALANPSAALLTLVLPRARSWILGLLGTLGSLVAAYILATAALSPQPPLMGTTAGEALVVSPDYACVTRPPNNRLLGHVFSFIFILCHFFASQLNRVSLLRGFPVRITRVPMRLPERSNSGPKGGLSDLRGSPILPAEEDPRRAVGRATGLLGIG